MQIIETAQDGQIKTIDVQECGRRVNAFLFLTMLNHYDKFVHEMPMWKNKIWTGSQYEAMCANEYVMSRSNTSASF